MACGTPVIGLDRGALSEIVVHGLNGYIGKNMDDLVLAVKQINLINRAKVRQHVETYFSSTIIVDEYLALYQQMIKACQKH
jgi:glycosyltransferase involved in cell wall biosynthesis